MADSLKITIIQTDLQWEDKQANLTVLEKKIMSVGDTEIIILPEMFSTGFTMKPALLAEKMDGPTVTWMKNISARKKVILTGSLVIEEDGQYFNRLIWMLPNGQYGIYDKRHRFAYAGEDQHYAAGSKRLIASVKGWKINLQVCYDLRFPVWARQQKQEENQPEYDVLIYVANWPERRSEAWRTLLKARAIENQSYVVGVNRTGTDGNGIYHSGESMIIDAMGEILYSKKDEEDIFSTSIDKLALSETRSRLPFLKDGDFFQLLT